MAEPVTAQAATAPEPTKVAADESAAAEANYRRGLKIAFAGGDPDAPDEPAAKPEVDVDAKPVEDEEDTEPAADDDADADIDAPEVAEAEADPVDDDQPPGDKDEPYAKAFLKLQKEKRAFQAFKSSVLAKEAEVAATKTKLEQSEGEIVAFVQKLRRDPFKTLLDAGLLTADDAEYVSQQLHFNSAAAAKDPRNRAEAERLRAARELALEVRETKAEMARLRAEQEESTRRGREEAAAHAQVDKFRADLNTQVKQFQAKTPIFATAMKQDAAGTKSELEQLAGEMYRRDGKIPAPIQVLLAWTKREKTILARQGVAAVPEAKTANATKQKGTTDATTKTKTAPTVTEEHDAAYWDAHPDEYKAEIRRLLKGEK